MNRMESMAHQFRLLDKLPMGICMVRKDLTVLYWNHCQADWTGVAAADIVDRDLGDRFPQFRDARFRESLAAICEGADNIDLGSALPPDIFADHKTLNSDGKKRIQKTSVMPIPSDGREFYALLAVEDITELCDRVEDYRTMQNRADAELDQRRGVEAKLRAVNRKVLNQQEDLIEEERVKVLLQVAGATAHELNQPLMGLLGNIELMQLYKNEPQKLFPYIEKIHEAGERISEIINNIESFRHNVTNPPPGTEPIINLEQTINVLSVEDSDEDFDKLRQILDTEPLIKLDRRRTIKTALGAIEENGYHLILMDYALPDGDGLGLLKTLETSGNEIPVVVISGLGDEMVASRVIQAGAYDYLPKDRIRDLSLPRVIESTLERARLKKEIKTAQEKMAQMSARDELTGLYNRRYFNEALEREISRAKRYDHRLVLGILDLDFFKNINDTYGHPAGDAVLADIGKLLRDCFRQSDLISRYGGEEFAVILPNTQIEEARVVSERFRELTSNWQFRFKTSKFKITISIGIAALRLSDPQPLDELVIRADNALYQAKQAGRNRVIAIE